MATFDGENLIITLDSGITEVDWIDIYSDWKDWMLASPFNRGYPEAFSTSGGEELSAVLEAGAYWFLRNDLGWRMRPPEEHITIWVTGNLIPQDITIDSFLPTIGAYTTQILGLQPITQTALVGSGVTEQDKIDIATAVWADVDAEFLLKVIRNKKALEKNGSVWELIIYDDDDTTPILTKALKDKDVLNIADLETGTLAMELQTSV